MDKGRRNELARLKQKKRLTGRGKDMSWMKENQIGQLKNHQIYTRCRCSYCVEKYNRTKNKNIDLDED